MYYNSQLNNTSNIAIDKYINKENLRKRSNEQSECDWSKLHTFLIRSLRHPKILVFIYLSSAFSIINGREL